ncbi:MAG: hypothetical protein LC785_05665 [Acidobacteria bacterium]|nr:hypothetical protein [Acidobacteriota bacterium]MCA1641438.1 hypothetical protein [Acidobacteriota bacterium]
MSRQLRLSAFALVLVAAAGAAPCLAQTPSPTPTPAASPTPEKTAPPPVQIEKEKAQRSKAVTLRDLKNPTAEQVVETVIVIYGLPYGRPVLNQVRRNGVENGRVTRTDGEGRTVDISYEQRFIHGESLAKDKIRLDQKTPAMEFAIVYNAGQIWGVINGTPFTPREDATKEFLSQAHHGIDTLLRYKENDSTITYAGRDKQKNIDLWMIDVTDKGQRKTRFYISANQDPRLMGRVLWLEYEEPGAAGGEPVKFRRTFHEYRYAQNTLVPYRSVLYADGRQVEEARIFTVTYGVKMDETYFLNPQAAAN